MPIGGLLPAWLLPAVAAATIFVVMLDLGVTIGPAESRWAARRPALVAQSLFAVLVAVPALAWIVVRVAELPREVEIGILLMAIAPGAPVALRRSLEAGGHRTFAPALQIAAVTLAVVSMPLSMAAFDEYYGGTAAVAPQLLARQVFMAQLLPLGLGMLLRRIAPLRAAWLEPKLNRISGVLLAVLIAVALLDLWPIVAGAEMRVAVAIVAVTALSLLVGHFLGGQDPSTRTASAIATAMRNPGLALLAATLNAAPPQVAATVLAYFVFSGFTVLAYVAWRRRRAGLGEPASEAAAPPVLPGDAEQVEVVAGASRDPAARV